MNHGETVMQNMRKNKYIYIGATLLLLVLLWQSCRREEGRAVSSTDVPSTAAEIGPMTIKVSGAGEIRSIDSHKIIPKIKKSTMISYLIEEGRRVKKGEVVARLNTDEIERRIEDLEVRIVQEESLVDSARTEREIQELDNSTHLKTAQQDLENARMDLEKFMEADLPLDRRSLALDVQTASSLLQRKKSEYEEMQLLLDEGFVTEAEVEETRIEVEEAQIKQETATLKRVNAEKYDHPQKKARLENALSKAEAELHKAVKRNQTLLKNKQRSVESAALKLARSKQEIDEAREDLKELTIRAPAEGVVQYGTPEQRWRRAQVQVGANTHPGMILLTIPGLEDVEAIINISEADIQKVAVDQRAIITVDALPNQTFSGNVGKIIEVANDQHWTSGDVKEFTVEVQMEADANLKPGFSCRAEIITDEVASALQVPVQAVFREDDQLVVYMDEQPPRRRKVEVGRSSLTHVEVLMGLEEGERVLMAQPK